MNIEICKFRDPAICLDFLANPQNKGTQIITKEYLLNLEAWKFRTGRIPVSFIDETFDSQESNFVFQKFNPFFEVIDETLSR